MDDADQPAIPPYFGGAEGHALLQSATEARKEYIAFASKRLSAIAARNIKEKNEA